MSERLLLDLNDPEFQEDLFRLSREQQVNVLATLGKLAKMVSS